MVIQILPFNFSFCTRQPLYLILHTNYQPPPLSLSLPSLFTLSVASPPFLE
jgi:hypothetical protein